MRISALSATTGVPIPTIKYYLREGLLPEGVRTGATQADYSDAHAQRLRVIRALVASGVSIAEVRRVLAALDTPPPTPHDLLGVAHEAVTAHVEDDGLDLTDAQALAARLGAKPGMPIEPSQLRVLARALATTADAGFEIPAPVMDAYVASARRIAEAEIDGVPTDSPEAAVGYVVLGTVLPEPVLLALRRIAEQVVSAERFAGRSG